MKKECKDCGAELTIPQDSMVGEIITCPDCGTDFEIVSKNRAPCRPRWRRGLRGWASAGCRP